MKRLAIAAILIAALGAPLQAAPPPGADVLGIYTADDGTGYAHARAAVFSEVVAHLVLSGCTSPDGVAGWECTIDVPPNCMVTSWDLRGPCLNIAGAPSFVAGPDFAVGLFVPVPREEVILLCSMEILVQSAEPAYFHLRPLVLVPTMPGCMCYSRGNEIGELVRMRWSSGSVDLPVFGINTGPLHHVSGRTIATVPATWGEVKAMYR
jgi:hypothetical protein